MDTVSDEFLDSDRVANVYFTITSTSTNDVLPLYNRCNNNNNNNNHLRKRSEVYAKYLAKRCS